jgi:hypothetical protein
MGKKVDLEAEARERFKPEYSVVEALIACLIDGMAPRTEMSRKQRVRIANKAITGEDIDRLDEPDSLMSRGLYEMQRRQERNYLTQVKPEYGGLDEPLTEYEAALRLAKIACEAVGLDPDANAEKLRKRYTGSYWRKLSKEEKELARDIPWIIYPNYDDEREKEMLSDFEQIASILSKYEISMSFENVFWRTLGNEPRSVPNKANPK